MSELRFADDDALHDFATYVARARALDAEGAMRLQAGGMAVAAYVGVLPGQGLMAQGAVLGLRVMPLAESATLDVTVSLASLTDRLARTEVGRGDGSRLEPPGHPGPTRQGVVLSVPPTTVSAGWAAMAPPRSGWEPVGRIDSDELRTIATDGIAQIAHGAPEGSGGHAVASLRQRVWGRETETVPPIPAGAAFAAYVLGFLALGDATVLANGRWTRLSTQAGHVLVR